MDKNTHFEIIYNNFVHQKNIDEKYILALWINGNDTKNDYNVGINKYTANDYYFSCIVSLEDC